MTYTAERRAQLGAAQQQLMGRASSLLAGYKPAPQGYAWPLTARTLISSRFGRRRLSVAGNTFHSGVDVVAPVGTPVAAARDGVVSKASWGGTYGYVVYVEHGDGSQTRYAHLSRFAVRPGDALQQGQTLGWVGVTGSTTGPHLHFEIRLGGRAVDPLNYLPR